MPKPNEKVEGGKSIGVVESVKSVSDIFSPLTGEITETNEEVESNPEIVNKEPYKGGWMFKIKVSDPTEAEVLLDAAGYQKLLGGQ